MNKYTISLFFSFKLFCRLFFFFSSRRRHTRWPRDWSSDVCSSDLCVYAFPLRTGLALRSLSKSRIVVEGEDGDVREGSQPAMGRRKRIRGMGHPGHEDRKSVV